MYDNTINVSNKIITYDDLIDIFGRMNEKMNSLQKIYKSEETRNRMLDFSYQVWTYKQNVSNLKFDVNFYDNTEIQFDNYNSFITIFQNRLEEIKSIYVHFYISYSTKTPNSQYEYYSHSISMYIYENKIDISTKLNSEDKKIDEIYELIQNKILNAQVKYDNVVKNRSSIVSTVGFSIGFIPTVIGSILLLFIPTLKEVLSESYVLYPLFVLGASYVIGSTCCTGKIDELYKPLLPDKKYINYNKGYKDDIEKYVNTSEILIGKNTDNLKNRKIIMDEYSKCKSFLPIELIILIILSIVVIIL